MKQKTVREKSAPEQAKIQRQCPVYVLPLLLLLGAIFFAPHAMSDPMDLGGVFYELDNDLQEPAKAQSSPAIPLPAPISFDCSSGLAGLACTDNHHLRYHCSDYGASGQYCKRQDGKVWIHCFPRFFHRYHCTVISNTSGRRH